MGGERIYYPISPIFTLYCKMVEENVVSEFGACSFDSFRDMYLKPIRGVSTPTIQCRFTKIPKPHTHFEII